MNAPDRGLPRSTSAGAPRAFSGGRIVTMDPFLANPEVVIIENGRIAAVGERALLEAYPGIVVESLGGRTLVPGFIDAHNHLSIAALQPLWADLSAVTTLDELRRTLHEQAAREPEARWIRGWGWNEATTGLALDRRDLDALDLPRPVIVAHFTLHQGVVSSAGLDELEIGHATADPPGGLIACGPDGAPTGLLVERAWSDAHARSVAAYHDPDRWSDLFIARGRALWRDGITCVHDAACAPAAERVYESLHRRGLLPLAIVVMPHRDALLGRLDAARLDGRRSGDGDEWLRVGAVKLFADGGVAPCLQITMGGQPGTPLGILFPGLVADAEQAATHGFDVAVHAIGNRGLAQAIDAFTTVRDHARGDVRVRVEHACFASRPQLAELAALGAVGVVQPGFVHHIGAAVEGVPFEEEIWLAFHDMIRAGMRLAASSDDPCALHEPLRTAAIGATRRTAAGGILGAEQALGYEEWLRLYTAGAAYAGRQEYERGTLTPGKCADLVVLAGALDPEHPPRVAQTWIAGELVYTG